MSPRRLGPVLLVLCLGLGCGDQGPTPGAKPGGPARDRGLEAAARSEAFLARSDWAGLIGLLGQSHTVARSLLGPHRLHYTASLETGPAGLAAAAPLPAVAVDEPIYARFEVHDELTLLWAAATDEGPRFSLEQHNQHQRARGVLVLGEQLWSSIDGGPWLLRPLESDLWRLWMDDAFHAPLDLVQFAGPAVEIAAVAAIDHEGRRALQVSLVQSGDHPERVVEGPIPWRRGLRLALRSATLVIDRDTGVWLDAQIELDWSFQDGAERELAGHATLNAKLEPLELAPTLSPPLEAQPLPERERPELLRERLLSGLAGP